MSSLFGKILRRLGYFQQLAYNQAKGLNESGKLSLYELSFGIDTHSWFSGGT